MKKILEFYHSLYSDNKPWIKKAIWWFVGSGIVGVVVFFAKPSLLMDILSVFEDRFGADPALDLHLAQQIFLQNLLVSSIALFGGLIFGLSAIFVIAANGFLLGYIITSVFFIREVPFGQSLALVLGGLVPHGIFELPAFLFAGALGMRLGLEWLGKNAKGSRWPILKKNLIQSYALIPIIILFLIIAALIEVFVSGKIVGKM